MLLSLGPACGAGPGLSAGGVWQHSHAGAGLRQSLAAGAVALQLDSVVWVEPGIPALLAAQLAAPSDGERG
ncbi:MAG: hypothetical protein R3A10_22650 [Caldilineaceae bacterium]